MITLMYRLIIDNSLVGMNLKREMNISIILYLEVLVQNLKINMLKKYILWLFT